MNPTEPHSNPLLKRAALPGQTFALPSLGAFYSNNELDNSVKNGEVMVLPMVTMDELIFKSPDKLLNGTAVTEVFGRCIPQILRPEELLAKDVDYLLICLRKVTYGEEIQLTYTHNCKDAKEHSYKVPLQPLLTSTNKMHQTQVAEYTLTLPNGQVVELRPPKYITMLKFYQAVNDDADDDIMRMRIIETTLALIRKVDDISDMQMIREWLGTISAGYTRKIGEHVAELSQWGPDLHVPISCQDCKEEVKAEISLNPIHFFS